ncbi:MAG: type I polyketide synthase [Ktedonobacteraceae bacterium]
MGKRQLQRPQEPLAVIGIGCRFPGGANPPVAFWQMLLYGIDAVTEVPSERWDLKRYYHPDPAQPGKMYARHGAFLDQVDQFDAAFFGISAVEASRMDPQQRLLLEVSWEALEDAGLPLQQLTGSATGTFMGVCASEYADLQRLASVAVNPYTNAGGALSIATNRLAYFFDWHGPSMSIDTACSSSLVAVHLACQSLWNRECSLALAGGVSVLLNPQTSIGFSKAQMLSPSGRCHSFDARADGYVRGEGAGAILLKPLSAALEDGDQMYGIIRATAINQDGRTPSLHYPGQQAQEALLRHVYTQEGIASEQVCYVEAHGTGTIAGDQVECFALGAFLGPQRSLENPLRIGSVKTNVGHLEGASGMAGLIKTLLLLQHRQIPANLHFEQPNPQIPFADLRLQV